MQLLVVYSSVCLCGISVEEALILLCSQVCLSTVIFIISLQPYGIIRIFTKLLMEYGWHAHKNGSDIA